MTCQINSICESEATSVCVCLAFYFCFSRIFLTSSFSKRFPFEFSIKASFQFGRVCHRERAVNTLRMNIYAKFHKLQSHIHTEWSRVFIISERRTRGKERENIFRHISTTKCERERGTARLHFASRAGPSASAPLAALAFHIDFYQS